MNKINDLPKDIPETTSVFTVDVVGRITKRRFVGEFKCRIPTIRDQGSIARHQSMLNGEYAVYLDDGIQKIHKMIAYLRYTIIDSPIFWKDNDLGYALHDDNVVTEVYDKVIKFENDWLKSIWGDGSNESGNEKA